MKDVRLFYEKTGNLKFISHLDMNRFFSRVIRKTNLDVWYTEGFNPHPYIAFAQPLSLGFESKYEIVDFRVNDDSLSFQQIADAFSLVVPNGIKIIKAQSPVLKTGKIAFTKYEINFDDSNIANAFLEFLNSCKVVITKKSKKGEIKQIDVTDKLNSVNLKNENTVELILPAGNDNINPSLLVASFNQQNNSNFYAEYLRTEILDERYKLFE